MRRMRKFDGVMMVVGGTQEGQVWTCSGSKAVQLTSYDFSDDGILLAADLAVPSIQPTLRYTAAHRAYFVLRVEAVSRWPANERRHPVGKAMKKAEKFSLLGQSGSRLRPRVRVWATQRKQLLASV